MQRATIYRLPTHHVARNGRAVADSIQTQARDSGRWTFTELGQLVPAGAATPPPSGTPTVQTWIDVARREVMVRIGQIAAKPGQDMPSVPLKRRLHLIRDFLTDAGIDANPALEGYKAHCLGAPMARTAGCASHPDKAGRTVLADEVARRSQHGPPLVCVVSSKGNQSSAQLVLDTLQSTQLKRSEREAMWRDIEIHDGIVTSEKARHTLAAAPIDRNRERNRRRTVLIYVLPPRHVELHEDSPEVREFRQLTQFKVPVLCQTPDTNKPAPLNTLLLDVWHSSGAVPWTLDHDFRTEYLIGIDAAHAHETGCSTWAGIVLDPEGTPLLRSVREGRLDESFNSSTPLNVLRDLLTGLEKAGCPPGRVLIHRDGRQHRDERLAVTRLATSDWSIRYVPVAKRAPFMLYRDEGDQYLPPQPGDALFRKDAGVAYVATGAGGRQPERVLKVGPVPDGELEAEVRDVVAAVALPKPGLYFPSNLPVTTYWADRYSKRNLAAELRVGGRPIPMCQPSQRAD